MGLVGKVKNAYTNINVLTVHLQNGLLSIGDVIEFRKSNQVYKHMISSMEINHERVNVAYPGPHYVGIKVPRCSTKGPCSRNAAVYLCYGAANFDSYSKW